MMHLDLYNRLNKYIASIKKFALVTVMIPHYMKEADYLFRSMLHIRSSTLCLSLNKLTNELMEANASNL